MVLLRMILESHSGEVVCDGQVEIYFGYSSLDQHINQHNAEMAVHTDTIKPVDVRKGANIYVKRLLREENVGYQRYDRSGDQTHGVVRDKRSMPPKCRGEMKKVTGRIVLCYKVSRKGAKTSFLVTFGLYHQAERQLVAQWLDEIPKVIIAGQTPVVYVKNTFRSVSHMHDSNKIKIHQPSEDQWDIQGGPEKNKPKLFLIINSYFHKTMTLFAAM